MHYNVIIKNIFICIGVWLQWQLLEAATWRELCYYLVSHYYLHILPQNVWTLFAENNFSHNALVAVLHHFVQVGQHKRADAQQRIYALHAAGLYFLLLEIPGEQRDVPLRCRIKHRSGKISFLSFIRIPGGTSDGSWTVRLISLKSLVIKLSHGVECWTAVTVWWHLGLLS